MARYPKNRQAAAPAVPVRQRPGAEGHEPRIYDRQQYLELVDYAQNGDAGVWSLTSDVIVGFPGETEAEFEETVDADAPGATMTRCSPSSYSPRRGTPAASLPDPPRRQEKNQRNFDRLLRRCRMPFPQSCTGPM